MKRFTKDCLVTRVVATIATLFILQMSACQQNESEKNKDATLGEKLFGISKSEWMRALMNGDKAQIEAGIRKGFDPNLTNQHGDSAFMWLAYRGYEDWVYHMINQSADLNYTGSYGKSAMHLAAEEGHDGVVETLLKSGAAPYLTDHKGRTPLELAVEKNQLRVVQYMLRNEINPMGLFNRPLMQAVEAGNKDLVLELVLAGAAPDHVSEDGKTPIKRAVELGYEGLFTQEGLVDLLPNLPMMINKEYRVEVVNADERPKIDAKAMALHIHKRINAIREDLGLPSLSYDLALEKIATSHSKDMARRKFFDHVNPEGQNPTHRAKALDFVTRVKTSETSYKEGIAENIYKTRIYAGHTTQIRGGTRYITRYWHTPSELADMAVDGWMNSPGHRANIVNSEAKQQGIGIAVDSDDAIYFTQNLF